MPWSPAQRYRNRGTTTQRTVCTERPGGYPANGAKVGELPKPPKEATTAGR